MSLIVQKFGGSSVKDAERVRNVASIVTEAYKKVMTSWSLYPLRATPPTI